MCNIGGQAHAILRAHCAHYAHFSTMAKPPKENFRVSIQKGGDEIRPFKLRVIRRESVKLGQKDGAFNA
jgi:hypothetical protein